MSFTSTPRQFLIGLLFPCLLVEPAYARQKENRQQPAVAIKGEDDEQRINAVTQLIALFGADPGTASDETLNSLANSLQSDSSPIVRALSARALENCCGERAVPHLLSALNGEREVAVRKAIYYALASYGSPQVISALTAAVKDKRQELRGAAAYTLAEIGDASSAPVLLEVLQRRKGEEDAFARSQAARGLGRMAYRAAMSALLDSLSNDKSGEVRRECARALGLIANAQDLKVIEALRNSRLQPDPYLSSLADKALEAILQRNP